MSTEEIIEQSKVRVTPDVAAMTEAIQRVKLSIGTDEPALTATKVLVHLESKHWFLEHRTGRARGDEHGLRKHPERAARGERHSMSKLTDSQVQEIREWKFREPKTPYRVIAEKYGVSTPLIAKVVTRQTRQDIDG